MKSPCPTVVLIALLCLPAAAGIDRAAVVARHRIVLHEADPLVPLSVGNGRFCFTADLTGLQTFEAFHDQGIPLTTMADWSWHSAPNPQGFKLEDALVQVSGVDGKSRPYPINPKSPAGDWLRANPHRFGLGRVGLVWTQPGGKPIQPPDLVAPQQSLDPWTGLIQARFQLQSQPVEVATCALQGEDGVAFRITSPLLTGGGGLGVRIDFAYPNGAWGKNPHAWGKPDLHATRSNADAGESLSLERIMDGTRYRVELRARNGRFERTGPHEFILKAVGDASLEGVVVFREDPENKRPVTADFEQSRSQAAAAMAAYWQAGGIVDLSGSKDPRWRELERRIILSVYLTAIQSRGRYCAAETGLTATSWHGKFHLEMHWWHSVHFALWGHGEVLSRQLDWYRERLPVMRENARRQGYQGVRWGKMLGPDGRESPSGIGPLLVWQQPHPIYYAELLRRLHPDQTLPEDLAEIVDATAAFMADFATWNPLRKVYELGPPFISAREFGAASYASNHNGAFELAYWQWGLLTANAWREQRGLPPRPEWAKIAAGLAPLPIRDGRYIEQEAIVVPDGGHPCQLAAFGLLPGSSLVDKSVMLRTMDHALHQWNHASTWGWDYPLMAFTAARLGRGDWAVDSLLLDQKKNTYLRNGHNFQTNQLPLYLPGNGGLLTAVAMMAAGWDGCPPGNAPGFPQDGQWVVLHEGLAPMP